MKTRALYPLLVAVGCAVLVLGSSLVFGHEDADPPTPPLPGEPSEGTTGRIPCGEDGLVHAGSFDFACSNVDLLAWEPVGGIPTFANDIWGWTDALTSREYVVMGGFGDTAFIDLGDPEAPLHLGSLPSAAGESFWGGVKTYGDYAYIVKDFAGDHGLQVFDLTQLRSVANPPAAFTATEHYTGFGNAHNIAVNEESGFAYVVGSTSEGPGLEPCGGGLHMLDLSDPASPQFAGCFSEVGYIHDTQCVNYHGPDPDHDDKEICFNASPDAGGLTIVDVTQKDAPQLLGSTSYPGVDFPHQGWLTEDQAFFLFNDEGDEVQFGHNTRTYVFDVGDLDAPALVGYHEGEFASTDHNLFIRGDLVFEANYSSGLRVFHLGNPAALEVAEIGFFDSYPPSDEPGTTFGPWSVYPFFPSGTVVMSDILLGLFVFQVPEPSSLALQLSALAAVALLARPRTRRTSATRRDR